MPMRYAALPILAVTTVAAASPPAGTVQSYDGYKSWLVACDNGLHCQAKAFGDSDTRAEIRIERDAGPAAAARVTLRSETPFRLADVRVDGAPAQLDPAAWEAVPDDEGRSWQSDRPNTVRPFLAQLRAAGKATLGAGADVPLDGLSAALLRIDDRQGRVGTVTALARLGPAPAARVPAPPPIPAVPAHPIAARLAAGEARRLIASVRAGQRATLETEGCDAQTMGLEPEAHALDDGRALILIPCLMGAYQGSSLAFIASRRGPGAAKRLVLPIPYIGNASERSDADMFTEVSFDRATGTLSMAAKGRGLADCGLAASWIWNGAAFRLSALSLQQACGGIEPGDWPTLFRSRQ